MNSGSEKMIQIIHLVFIIICTSCIQDTSVSKYRENSGSKEDTSRKEHLLIQQEFLKEAHLQEAELHELYEREDSMMREFEKHDKDSFYMVGVWHASDCVGSGYSDLYVFYENGTFIYYENQMDCSNRLISMEGSWKNKNNMLTLTISKKTIWTGGKLVPVTDGSCASDSMLVDAKEKVILLSPNETKKITLSTVYYEEDLHRKTMKFDKTRFWRIFTIPEEFEYF